jgi:hypothetical protein
MNNIFLVALGVIGGGIATAVYTAIVTKKYATDYNKLLSQHQQLQGRYDELVRQNGSTKAAKVPAKTTQPMVSYIGPEDGYSQLYERFGPEQ